MAYGLSVLNDSDFIQIDSDYQNYVLIQEGSATTGTNVTFPAADAPLVMVGPSPANSGYEMVELTGSMFNVKARQTDPANCYAWGNASDFTFQYRVYGRAGQHVPVATTGYGFQVYTPSGLVAFDSSQKYLRAKQVASVAASSLTSVNSGTITAVTISLPGTYTPFVLLNGASAQVCETDFEWFYFVFDVKSTAVKVGAAVKVASEPNSSNVRVVTSAIFNALIGA